MNNKTLIGIVLVAIVAIGAFLLFSHASLKAGSIATQDNSSSNYTQLGVSNGLFVTGGGIVNTQGCQSNGGVTTCVVRQTLVSGTSTPCAIADPITGTSTVKDFALNITTATSSAIAWAVGTSTTAYATTTTMTTQTIGAGAQATIAYYPVSGNIVAAGQFVIAGANAGTASATGAYGTGIVLGGTCQATFQSVN